MAHMLLKPTIGVLLCAGCVALNLRPQGEKQGQQTNEDVLIRLGTDPNSSQLVPRILIASGCSGSSFAQSVARRLLERHGFEVDPGHRFEAAKPQKNEVYRAEPQLGMGHAMDKIATMAEEQNHVFVFKAEPRDLIPEIVSAMNAHRARVVHVFRRNVLDRAVCNVRDCFTDSFGYPVDANGQRSNVCMQRRFNHTVVEKAHLNEHVLEWMQKRVQEENGMANQLIDWGFSPALTLEEEDLSAFQYGASQYNTCDVACSVRAWCRFLSSWGIDVKPEIVSSYLASFDFAHDPPGPHRDTIANYEEMKARLAGTQFAELWRD